MKTYKFMKRNSVFFLIGLLLSVAACSFTTKNKIDPGDNDKEEVLSELVSFVLSNYHYAPKDIDDAFSKNVYREYVKSLDARKRFLLQSDLEEFSAYETQIDDQLKNHSVEFFNLTYERILKRMEETQAIYKEILSKPFDFSKEEEINTDYENIDYPKTKEERFESWRKQLKLNVLSSYYDLKKEQDDKIKARKENAESAQEEEDWSPKTDAELEEKARENVLHSMEQFYDITKDIKKEDWFSSYLNAVANEFDPHTGYFAPPDKDRFDIAMSGSLEGIGAQLQKDIDKTKIVQLISGGPAWTDGRLKVGDVITHVKQEDEENSVSIVGMSLTDAVELIRGPKGSKVTLTVKSVDGTTKNIELTRDVVEIDETYAKSAITEKNGKKFGIIKLPSFYFDMEDYNQRNAASDTQKEIQYLKNQGMEGLVLDLRDNGGGSLSTAIDIAGLFVKKGPVVQVRSGDNQQQVLKNRSAAIEWDGPLIILVNELSASASEILAAAMQDYGRAIIIGSKQTYGKGTVQKFLDLNRFMRSEKLGDMGSIKITTQKFYRINGDATQLKGVASDVVVPDQYSHIDIGERDMEAPLPFDEIKSTTYDQWKGYTNYKEAIEQSKKRVDTSSRFKLIDDYAKWIKAQRDLNIFPLDYAAYKKKAEEDEKLAKTFKKAAEFQTNLTFHSLPQEIERFAKDSTLEKKRDKWHEDLAKDLYVEEALRTLSDLKLSDNQLKKMADARSK